MLCVLETLSDVIPMQRMLGPLHLRHDSIFKIILLCNKPVCCIGALFILTASDSTVKVGNSTIYWSGPPFLDNWQAFSRICKYVLFSWNKCRPFLWGGGANSSPQTSFWNSTLKCIWVKCTATLMITQQNAEGTVTSRRAGMGNLPPSSCCRTPIPPDHRPHGPRLMGAVVRQHLKDHRLAAYGLERGSLLQEERWTKYLVAMNPEWFSVWWLVGKGGNYFSSAAQNGRS